MIISMANQNKNKTIDLRNGYCFKKKEGVTDEFMLSTGQVKMMMDTLVTVALFYKEKGYSHGNYSPENMSKKFIWII
jgi:hypothetical protein